MKTSIKILSQKLLVVLFSMVTMIGFGQIEEELGFLYVKADYMIETERFEEAAVTLTEIIESDPGFKDALVKRAECFYEIGEYNRSIDDVLKSFKVKGVSSQAIKIFGMANAAKGNYGVADETLNVALLINYRDPVLHFAKAENFKNQENFDAACEHWETAANLGHEKSRLQLSKYCGVIKQNTKKETRKKPMYKDPVSGTKLKLPSKKVDETAYDDKVIVMDEGVEFPSDSVYEREGPIEDLPKIDDSVVELEVDEELSLVFKNGIGSRKILQQPDILILSENSGNVAVDVCINRRGKVESSEYNKKESTLKAPSLISLAQRKSQEFWFEKNDEKEMCGTIVFKINGGS